jgi:hypothetical protein
VLDSTELQGLIDEYMTEYDEDFLLCCRETEVTLQDIMKALNLPSDDKFKFVCMPDSQQKVAYLTGQLRYLKLIRKQESLLGDDFGLN